MKSPEPSSSTLFNLAQRARGEERSSLGVAPTLQHANLTKNRTSSTRTTYIIFFIRTLLRAAHCLFFPDSAVIIPSHSSLRNSQLCPRDYAFPTEGLPSVNSSSQFRGNRNCRCNRFSSARSRVVFLLADLRGMRAEEDPRVYATCTIRGDYTHGGRTCARSYPHTRGYVLVYDGRPGSRLRLGFAALTTMSVMLSSGIHVAA